MTVIDARPNPLATPNARVATGVGQYAKVRAYIEHAEGRILIYAPALVSVQAVGC